MTIAVFGATGQVGKQLVKQALFNGHQVKAFGRNVFTEFGNGEKNLELIKGGVFDEGEVLHAVKGCDAVLSALGGSFDGTDKSRSLGIKNIITQMQKAGVQRIVALGGMGILNFDENTLLMDTEDYPKQYLPVGEEHRKAYEFLKTSGLNWTFVCSPDIINAAATGEFITSANYPPEPNQYKINAGDLALFMLRELKQNDFVGMRVGISEK
jgi:uncharacterized protein